MKIIQKLNDDQYPFSYIDHVRKCSRGVVINDKNEVALIKLHGFDSFGDRNYYELPGGGVQKNEKISDAFLREMKEEIGYQVEIISPLGQVRDFYNLIHRENHNYYFVAKTKQWVGTKLEDYEKTMIEQILWMPIDDAIEAFKIMQDYGCGILVKRRELPILLLAKKLIS
jgi:8-oxo-dGTP pyrophosphatase MutT (NUDIX family)